MTLEVGVFAATTIAMCAFFVGYAIISRSRVLRDFGIPEPLIGGFACAIVLALAHLVADVTVTFDLTRRDTLLVYFFAALGLRFSPRELVSNGRPLLVLVALAAVFIVVQNAAGITLARLFGYDPQVGVVAGSMSLIGRSGTTVAWAPVFRDRFGFEHVSRLGIALNMAGLIAACCMGGPIARTLINRFRLATPEPSGDVDVAFSQGGDAPKVDYRGFLLALLRIHLAIIAGSGMEMGADAAGLHMPLYVWCLVAGIALGNVKPEVVMPAADWWGSDHCLTLIAYVSLGLFYTMTLMSLQLWTAGEFFGFVMVAIVVHALITAGYVWLVVFPLMGRDYDAAVISAGFVGIALGSTATTMAIMTAVARQYGRAHRAFVIVPPACGIFIDIINSFAISVFARQ